MCSLKDFGMKKYYDHIFSKSGQALRASEIRELLKLLNKPEMISFAGGLPNPDVFPIEKLQEITNHIIQNHARDALQYGATEGHNKLRDVIARGMEDIYGVKCNMQNVIITNGSQQALSLLSQIFLDPNDIVLTASPTYLGAILAFNSYQAKFETVRSDNNGIMVDLLEERLELLARRNEIPKFLYLIPTFQNPTGTTIPKDRRKKIYELISKYDLLLVEDDPYGFLRFEGEHEPIIKSFDVEGRVIYLGSFSKILAPGYRVAWVVAPDEIANKVTLAKQATDLCTNTFGQYCIFEAIHHDILFPHIKEIIKVYKHKRDTMLAAMAKYFPKSVKWNHPDGGLFIWVELPQFLNSLTMLGSAIDNNVAYVIGAPFFPNGGGHNAMRLNYSYASDSEINEGIKRLADVIKEEIRKKENELDDEYISTF